jgi:hypothetical protein
MQLLSVQVQCAGVVTTIAPDYKHFRGLNGVVVCRDQSDKQHLLVAHNWNHCLWSIEPQSGTAASRE